jgi:N-acetyl-anhydromuramyl-L-alanine amidase AmpD
MGDGWPFSGSGGLVPAPPRYVVAGTPNNSGRMGSLYGVILHGSRSGNPAFSLARGDGSEGVRTLRYVQTPGTTSYNWLLDYDGLIWELTGWSYQAWHAGHRTTSLHMNTNWFGVAFAQVDTWEPITDAQHASARWLLSEIDKRTAIPLVKLDYVASRYAARGVTEHRLTAQGQSGGKSDVGYTLDWSKLF